MIRRAVRVLLWTCCLLLSYQLFVVLRAMWAVPPAQADAGGLGLADALRRERAELQQTQPSDEARYADIWTRRLEPLAPEAPPPASARQPLGLTLEGVVLEPEHNFAFVRTGDGSLRAVEVGEQIANGKVKVIERARIVVEVGGQEVELPLEKAEQK